jgi:voltage-gated potassium channel
MDIKSIRKEIHEILSPHQKMSGLGFIVDLLLSLLIVLNVISISLESIDYIKADYSKYFDAFEWFSVGVFSVEYLARLWSASEKKFLKGLSATKKRFKYVVSFMGIIDLMVLLPFFIGLFIPVIDLRWMRLIRLLWLFKFSHFSPALYLFTKAVYEERKALFAAIYLLVIVTFLSSATIYFAEKNAQPEVFHSIPESLWWSFMTLTTVGYGDAVPITAFGRVIGVFTALLGVCNFAMLTGILANGLYNQTERLKKLKNIRFEDTVLKEHLTGEELLLMKQVKLELELSDSQLKKLAGILYQIPLKKQL